MLFIIAIF